MQYASCFVQLSGDLGTNIMKAPVTPAEVLVLRAIHGDTAVSKIELLNGGVNDKKSHAEEIERLRYEYTAINGDGRRIIDLVFPGQMPTLPTTFKEIGFDVVEAVKPKAAKGKKAKAEPAEEAVGDDNLEVETEQE